jgi:histidinol dehydrogenase
MNIHRYTDDGFQMGFFSIDQSWRRSRSHARINSGQQPSKVPPQVRIEPHILDGVIPGRVMIEAHRIFNEVGLSLGALIDYTEKFERHRITPDTMKVSEREIEAAVAAVTPADRKVLALAAKRIRAYHRQQKPKGFKFDDRHGTVIEERIIPLDRVGICIPGGRFPLASTVLMTAIPARIAGVRQIAMINPWPDGKMNPHVIAAAKLAGVDAIYKVGGVQGVAALALGWLGGRVDKIVGPGSIWVTAGKAIAVAGVICGIDSLAGPSEVTVVADESARAEWVAYDLLSQAEHGDLSRADLITTSEALIKKVGACLDAIIAECADEEWAKEGRKRIFAYLLRDRPQMAEAVNRIAPEHLEIMLRQGADQLAAMITNAASIFIGPYSPVPAGDYMAGGNHVLPTGGTARFASPLGVYDFVKRQSLTTLSRDGLEAIAEPVARFAELEGLTAHALSVRKRLRS